MQGTRGLSLGAWVVLCGGIAALTAAAFVPVTRPLHNVETKRPLPPVLTGYRPYPADSFARLAVTRDAFRATRRAASVAYEAQALVAAANAPPTPKPVLALVGIVAGREPTAVIEGFPGIDGPRVVRVGETVAGLRVTSIGRTDVRITGLDTVWVLTVRQPWR